MPGEGMRDLGRAAAVMLALALLLTGCGVGQGSAKAMKPGDPIKIGVLPVADFASVYIAVDNGYFEDEGLTVETQVVQNAAAAAPSVINGQLQFGTSALPPVITGAEKGLDLKVVTNQADVQSTDQKDPSGLMVMDNSPVKRPRDLEGKTVASNALGSVLHIAAAESIRADGGDPEKVKFVAMPFPDMVTALEQGRIDAAAAVEPFRSLAQSNGGRPVVPLFSDAFEKGESMAVLFTAGPFAEKNPDVVKKVRRAVNKALEDARDDPRLVQDVLIKHGGVAEKVARSVRQPGYSTTVRPQAITGMSAVMKDLGFVKSQLNGEELMLR